MENNNAADKILTVDIGGSHIKGTVLNNLGVPQTDYQKLVTPTPANPENVLRTVKSLSDFFPDYNKVSVGFPGYVKDGVVITAPNLGTKAWADFHFCDELQRLLGKSVRLVNDADMQGLGIVSGSGFEIMVTLGTGFGTAFLMNGVLLPHMELAHHPISKKGDYDWYIGEKAFKKKGKKAWNKRMQKVLAILKTVFNYDRLYIGGGNADELNFRLDPNIKIVTNQDGIKGGARLWADNHPVPPATFVTHPE